MHYKNDFKDIIRLLYSKRKQIGLVVGVVTLLTAIVSLFMPNYYKAVSSFYAASSDMAKVEHIFGRANKDMEYYGTDLDIERIMTIGNSAEMYQFLIDSFSLDERYKISVKKPKDKYRLFKKIEKVYSLQKNKFNVLELSFEDKDPDFAAVVANAARDKIDQISRRLMRSQQSTLVDAFTQNLIIKQETLNNLADSLSALRKNYNIVNVSSQSEMMATLISEVESGLVRETAKLEALRDAKLIKRDTIEFIAANVRGLEREMASLKAEDGGGGTFSLSRFNEGRSKIELLESRYYMAREHVGYDTERLKQLLAAYNANIPAIHIVEEASAPLIKSRPFRSLYVITAMLVSLLFVSLALLLRESFKEFSLTDLSDEATA
jgi:tyrosine-protein kinase Etk/Wzc